MTIWRPGVGRIETKWASRRYPEPEPIPDPQLDPATGMYRPGKVVERVTHPNGLTIETYGNPDTPAAPAEPVRVSVPLDDIPQVPPPSPKDWRKEYGLSRG